MCFIHSTSSRLGKSSRACAPRLSLRRSALCMVMAALISRFSSSRVSIRSVFQIMPRSVTCDDMRTEHELAQAVTKSSSESSEAFTFTQL